MHQTGWRTMNKLRSVRSTNWIARVAVDMEYGYPWIYPWIYSCVDIRLRSHRGYIHGYVYFCGLWIWIWMWNFICTVHGSPVNSRSLVRSAAISKLGLFNPLTHISILWNKLMQEKPYSRSVGRSVGLSVSLFLYRTDAYYAPAPRVGGIKRWCESDVWRLSVCRVHRA